MTQPAYIRHRGSSKPYLDIVSKYCWGVGEILRSSKFFTKSQADCSFSRMLSLTYVGDCVVGREGMEVGRVWGRMLREREWVYFYKLINL